MSKLQGFGTTLSTGGISYPVREWPIGDRVMTIAFDLDDRSLDWIAKIRAGDADMVVGLHDWLTERGWELGGDVERSFAAMYALPPEPPPTYCTDLYFENHPPVSFRANSFNELYEAVEKYRYANDHTLTPDGSLIRCRGKSEVRLMETWWKAAEDDSLRPLLVAAVRARLGEELSQRIEKMSVEQYNDGGTHYWYVAGDLMWCHGEPHLTPGRAAMQMKRFALSWLPETIKVEREQWHSKWKMTPKAYDLDLTNFESFADENFLIQRPSMVVSGDGGEMTGTEECPLRIDAEADGRLRVRQSIRPADLLNADLSQTGQQASR